MLCALRTNTFFVEHAEEVVTLKEDHCVLLCLCLHVLLKDYLIEEVLRCQVLIEQV